jgi:hypothetical protein
MKHNYNIRLNDPPPSDDQIAQHKNFDRILADYHHLTQPIYRKPLYKNPRAFIGLVFIFVIGFLVFEAVDEEKEKNALAEIPVAIRQAEQNAFLEPVRSELTVPYEEIKIVPNGQNLYELNNGLELKVPADAFSYLNGEEVSGNNVRLSVRLITDPVEMALAGIPMFTRDGQKPTQLESDFLLEIRAEAGGKPLKLKKGEKLTVLLPPSTLAPANDLKLYQLDTVQRNWVVFGPGYKVIERRIAPGSNFANLPTSDGMEMVEFDDSGKPIRIADTLATNGKDSAGTSMLYQRRLEIESLGMFGLDRRLEATNSEQSGLRSVKVRLTHPGAKAVETYALYKVVEGLNTVAYFWPQDKEFSFELSFVPDQPQTFFGFTEQGHLITVNSAALEGLSTSEEVRTIPVDLSPTPVKNIEELKQLLSDKDSH